ncbi:hypothetical protein ABZW18_21510 [Streptomyces sp. NPDC004647]|uniref:hypothetical protein n=1 Tax=Streptomyces sp. NPDC004647 TaxID=3154671 RepID=UPI0033B9AAE3
MRPDEQAADERVVAVLRDRLRAADEEIETPPGLWEGVRSAATGPRPATVRWRRPRFAVVALTAATVVSAVILGAWWLARQPVDDTVPPSSDSRPAVTLTVHNTERPCRELRTLECALRLAKDPYGEYAASGNAAARVWHGDDLAAMCVVSDGTLVEDEAGLTSTRWYLVRTGDRKEGWLPGVRTRNTAEVRPCSRGEVEDATRK